MNERIKWVDCAKGIAMFSVVLCHVVHGFYAAGLYSEHRNFLFAIENVADMFQMSLFTMASGFVFERIYTNDGIVKKDKVKKQIVNLCILYVVWEILLWCTKYIMSSQVNDSVDFLDLISIILIPIGPFWYLWMLIGFYILFSVKFIRKTRSRYMIPIFVILGLIGSCMRNPDIWGNLHLFYASFFYLGIIMARTPKRPRSVTYIIIAILTLGMIICFWSYEDRVFDMPIISYIIAFGVTVCLVRCLECVKEIKVLSVMGKYSIEIYTMHVFITSGGRVLIKMLDVNNVYLATVLLLFLGVALPLLVGLVLRKIKLYNYLFRPIKVVEKIKKN